MGGKKVAKIYEAMLDRHGTELDILLEQSMDDLASGTPDRVLEGIRKPEAWTCIRRQHSGK